MVRLFKNCSAELGEPNKSLFVEKLASPWFCGVRRKIRPIKIILRITQIIFNINYCNFFLFIVVKIYKLNNEYNKFIGYQF